MAVRQATLAATDAALVSETRRGDVQAFCALVSRHHAAVALAASSLGAGPGLPGRVFDVAHGVLVRHAGRAESVRPMMLRLVRALHEADGRALTPAQADLVSSRPFDDESSRRPRLLTQVAALPGAWQAALWHRVVEREDDGVMAAVVGVTPHRVGTVLEGAMDLVRRGLVARLMEECHNPACRGYGLRLSRSGADRPLPRSVLRHAANCASCETIVGDLAAVDTELPLVMADALLGTAGPAYVAARRGVVLSR